MTKPLIPSAFLPKDARELLIAASKVDPDKEESVKRARAISDATGYARMKYPQFFQQEK